MCWLQVSNKKFDKADHGIKQYSKVTGSQVLTNSQSAAVTSRCWCIEVNYSKPSPKSWCIRRDVWVKKSEDIVPKSALV